MSAPDFEGVVNPSIIEGESGTQTVQQNAIRGMNEVDARPPDFPIKAAISVINNASLTDYQPVVEAAPGVEVAVHENLSGANLSYQTTSDKSAPGHTDICKKNPSVVDKKSANTTSDKSAPGHTDVVRKNESKVDEESANTTPVGTRFKDANPTEYYDEMN